MNFPTISNAERFAKLQPPEGKIRMVIDTDTYNEIDDQFAVVHALLSPERLSVEGIYAAPFFNHRSTSPGHGMELSYDEILRLLDRLGKSSGGLVHRGSSGFLENLKAIPGSSAKLKKELANFTRITSLLDALNCRYQIDITSTHGFEYYTGLCFQISINNQRIGGGGRYNDLIPLIGGSPAPACGCWRSAPRPP